MAALSREVLLSLWLLFGCAVSPGSGVTCHCTSNCDGNSSTCSIDSNDLAAQCAMDMFITSDGQVSTVFYCHKDNTIAPLCDLSSPSLYTLCCNDDDQCNRCLLPEGLSLSVLEKVNLPADCPKPSFPVGTPSPSTTTDAVGSSLPSPSHPAVLPPWAIAIIALGISVSILVVVMTLVFICICKRRKLSKHQIDSIGNLYEVPFEPEMEDSESRTKSGSSGAGPTLLTERTLSSQIKMVDRIGKGRFGEVWLGSWAGDDVAIKVFPSKEQDSWMREDDIYRTHMLTHENVVRVFATDKAFACTLLQGLALELWLVMEYHPKGSLFDYLQKCSLSPEQALKMLLSIASGLHYIHLDITTGHSEKPGIAHRYEKPTTPHKYNMVQSTADVMKDIKSRNILVKRDGTCCITDFGLALRNTISNGKVKEDDVPSNPRQGTKRYMAPEILSGSITNPSLFESYKMVDMYCFSLVMWEVVWRSQDSCNIEYQQPYFNAVSHDPSFEEMYQVVVLDQVRPPIEQSWRKNEILEVLSSVMRQCWHSNPQARLNAFRVKKTFQAATAEAKSVNG